MKKDLVIGIVGTLILLTAMVGVFRYEAAQRGGGYDVAWETREVAGEAVEGAVNEGGTRSFPVMISQANVTRVEFVLEWTDEANTQPDEFVVTITSPSGAARSASGSAGSVSVVFEDLAIVPVPARLMGSEAEARARAERDYASQAAVGTWNVTIELTNAGDATGVPGGVPVPPQLADTGNTVTLTPRLTVYEARFSPA